MQPSKRQEKNQERYQPAQTGGIMQGKPHELNDLEWQHTEAAEAWGELYDLR